VKIVVVQAFRPAVSHRQGKNVYLVDSSCFLVGPTPPFSLMFGPDCSQVVPNFRAVVGWSRRADGIAGGAGTTLWASRFVETLVYYGIQTGHVVAIPEVNGLHHRHTHIAA
jgi:hypothetical protein